MNRTTQTKKPKMEKLVVNNFLVIKKADFEVGEINLIIGAQASGKSVLAKLLYFFREFLESTYLESVRNLGNKKDVEKAGLLKFGTYFPKYAWADKNFEIVYQMNDIEVSIFKKKKAPLKLDYSSNLISLHRKLKNTYRKKRKKYEEEEEKRSSENRLREPFWDTLGQRIYNTDFASSFNDSLFIPASRSFFANLQKNIFTFLASNIDIDPFMKDFGATYEQAKQFSDLLYKENDKKVNDIVEAILLGQYKQEEDEDWIISKNKRRINLANASSGQQEALPMLLVLIMSELPLFFGKNDFFIEEPEAHLFPVSQKHVVSLMALIHKRRERNFVITTHSPYILTAINNLIFAADIRKEHPSEEFDKQFDPDFDIAYEDVRAYTFENGKLVSVMDDETRLIGASVIDSVSDQFESEFDKLLSFQAGG